MHITMFKQFQNVELFLLLVSKQSTRKVNPLISLTDKNDLELVTHIIAKNFSLAILRN